MKKYKEFIEFEIEQGRTKFDWLGDDFKILYVTKLYDNDEPDNDVIKIVCEVSVKRTKTIHYWKTDYENYLIKNREDKLKELGL